jgi:DNA-3-methyladenine glycosylase II
MDERKEVYRVIKQDPVLKEVIRKTGILETGKRHDLYMALLHSIASQQLSAKAGDTIFGRFLDLFPGRKPLPELVVKCGIAQLRACGLSNSKASYMQNVAQFKLDGMLEYRKLKKMSDDELLKHLMVIKGVGQWTAEMILMFSLNRPDILPLDDVGIQNAMKHLYKIRKTGKELRATMEKKAEAWRPYRTLACRHLWRYMDEKNH